MKINKYIVITFLLSAITVFISTYFSISKSRLTVMLNGMALTSQHQISRIEHLYTITSNADDGVKNYIITGNPNFLISRDSSLARIKRTMDLIKGDISDDSDLLPDVNKLDNSIKVRINYLDMLVRARKESFDSAQKVVSTGRGTTQMDTIKSLVDYIITKERLERSQYTEQGEISIERTNFAIILGEFLALIIIVVILLRLNRDILKRMESEKQVQQSEIKFRTIAQNVGSFIYSCDYYGKVTFATPNIINLTGYYPDEIIGRHFTFMVAPEYKEELKDAYYKQFKNKIKEETTEFEIITKRGQRKWVKQDVVILSTLYMTMGFQCTIHDISDRKPS